MHVARALNPDDVIADCDEAFFNGNPTSLENLPSTLSEIENDICELRLIKNGVEAGFVLEFRVASDSDINGVEGAFYRLASGRRLDTRVVSDFIDGVSQYASAIRYTDGISNYLYGVLLKEDSLDIERPVEKYIEKFNSAAVALADYDRPLARTIAGLVAFHLNQFSDVVSVAAESRVGSAASRFIALLDGNEPLVAKREVTDRWEKMVTDLQSERIIQWAVQPPAGLAARIDEMEAVLGTDRTELDRPKLHMLLADAYMSNGNKSEARSHATEIRNIDAFERWAEGMIKRCS